ncbi:hemerythrin domain-containing protein [Streptomyces chartreusis]|uniref:hemerythrin domain-containing protein n=1 Tax=Streptomyces chartreusis TaxID=1969 RepID=UPI0036799A73
MVPREVSAALVDETLICEASRLLENAPTGTAFSRSLGRDGYAQPMADVYWPVSVPERLMHLSSLLDTVLLYDHLYVLSCQLPPDASRLGLRQALLDLGVVRILETTEIADPVSDELGRFFTQVEHPDVYASQRLAPGETLRDILQAIFTGEESYEYPDAIGAEEVLECFRKEVEGLPLYPWLVERRGELHADPLDTLGSEILRWTAYMGSGVATYNASLLRTFAYWRVAAHQGIPFVPSLRRIPSYQILAGHIHKSAQERVYAAVADSFHTAVVEVYEESKVLPLYLPPAVTLFFDHLRRNGGDVPGAVERLRNDHQGLRKQLARLQRELSASNTLGEAREARRRFKAALEQLGTEFGEGPRGRIVQLIDIAPEVAKVAANPLDVGSFTDELVQRPAEWIRSWWVRRPLRSAFDLKDSLLKVKDYGPLLTDATGQSCTPAEMAAMFKRFVQLNRFFASARIPGAPQRRGARDEGDPPNAPAPG